MRIIDPYVKIVYPTTFDHVMPLLERAGRTCYQSEPKGNPCEFIRKIIERGHESVIEHQTITVSIVCDRGISHEIVRHRIGSYSQESSRFCRYSNGVTFIKPFYLEYGSPQIQAWYAAMSVCEKAYLDLLAQGLSPEKARAVLPNSTKTQIVVTYNLREWRHFFKLRCSPSAHPQMRQIAIPLLHRLSLFLPEVFFDIGYDRNFPREHYARVFSPDEEVVECCYLIEE